MGLFDADEKSAAWVLVMNIALGTAMVLAAPFLAYRTIPTFLSAYQSGSWPTSMGTLTNSAVETTDYGGRRGIEFEPIVKYEYEVRGKPLVGKSIGFRGYGSSDEQEALAVVAKYAVGSRHPVYYNPSSPTDSVLERGTHWLTYAGLAIPVILLVVGGFIVNDHYRVLSRRRLARQEAGKTGQ